MTNLESLKLMSAEELAEVFNRITDYCPAALEGRVYCAEVDCKPCIVKWLNSEVRDDQF